jgi:uncharacterized protein YndB with AHSA1/START domain
MANPAPLSYVIYIAAPPEKVWEGFVSPESNAFSSWERSLKLTGGPAARWRG